MTRPLLWMLAISLALTAGCSPSTNSSPPVAPSSPSQAVDHATVTIQAFQFKPQNVLLKRGGTVTWVNADQTAHTASPDSGSQFMDTGSIAGGATSSPVVFNVSGVQPYHCAIHTSMTGTVTVQ